MPAPDNRHLIVQAAKWAVGKKNTPLAPWHYKEVRPIPLNLTFPKTTDCSGFVTWCYWVAGCADPNGQNYSGQGYTGTLLSHGTQINTNQVLAGDVVVYGAGTGEHTALVVYADLLNVLTISHGQEGDPSYTWVNKPQGTIPAPFNVVPATAVDGRKPQRFLRFPTAQIATPRQLPTV